MISLLLYAAIYGLGYGACHLLNLATRRVLVSNLAYGGLAVVAVLAIAHAALLSSRMPEGLTPEQQGEVIGRLVAGPALFVGVAVLGTLWWRRRNERNTK